MNITSGSRVLKISVYIFMATAVALAVLGLGFMTAYYQLFYDGTSEMYDFYKSIQLFNKALFNGAIVIVVMSVVLVAFDLNKGQSGPFGIIYATVVTIYTIMTSMVIFRAVPYYRNIYTGFDFSVVEGYKPSTLAFDLSIVLFVIAIAAIVVVLGSAIAQYLKSRKLKEN